MLSVSALFGDFGADNDDPVTMEGYTSAGVFVTSSTVPYGLGSTPVSISIAGANISYVLCTGGGPFPNSIFWDDFDATPVPEPMTFAVLGLGLAAIMLKRRR